MKAVVNTRYGSPDVLTIREVRNPEPDAGEVLIRVHTTTVSRTDCGNLRPLPPLIGRLMMGLFRPKHSILGMDFAGTVEALGAGVTAFKPGERVFGLSDTLFAAHAEYLCVPANGAIATVPEGVPFEEIIAMLSTLNEISDEMEPFSGTAKEGEALSRYLDSLNDPVASLPAQEEEAINGDLLFEDNCSSCHELGEMVEIVEGQGKAELVTMLGELNEITDEMEPFSGTAEEQDVLAEFLENAKKGGQ